MHQPERSVTLWKFAELRRVARFGLVGTGTAGLYSLILIVVVEAAGLAPAAGAGIAYAIAVAFNYLAHHMWTYRTDRPHRSAGPRYLILIAALFLANVLATALLPDLFSISYVTVQFGLAVLMVAVTFMVQSLWVFSRTEG